MNVFIKFKAFLRLREAIRRADNAHNENGERYYVMPSTDGKLLVTDRRNFRILKRKHYISDKATVRDLIAECFYFTPYRNGDGYITPAFQEQKYAQYLSWVAAMRRLKKEKRHK